MSDDTNDLVARLRAHPELDGLMRKFLDAQDVQAFDMSAKLAIATVRADKAEAALLSSQARERPRPYLTHDDDTDSACDKCGCPFPKNATCWNTYLDALRELRASQARVRACREALEAMLREYEGVWDRRTNATGTFFQSIEAKAAEKMAREALSQTEQDKP